MKQFVRISVLVVALLCIFFNSIVFANTPTNKPIIVTAKNPIFTIRLKCNPTTGYSWFLADYKPRFIVPIKHQFIPPNKKLIGAPGESVWTFKVTKPALTVPHQLSFSMVYQRPWTAVDVNVKKFTILVQ